MRRKWERKDLTWWNLNKTSTIWLNQCFMAAFWLLYDLCDLLLSTLCLQCLKGPKRARMTSSTLRKARTTSLTSHLLVRMIPETQYQYITPGLQTVQPTHVVNSCSCSKWFGWCVALLWKIITRFCWAKIAVSLLRLNFASADFQVWVLNY